MDHGNSDMEMNMNMDFSLKKDLSFQQEGNDHGQGGIDIRNISSGSSSATNPNFTPFAASLSRHEHDVSGMGAGMATGKGTENRGIAMPTATATATARVAGVATAIISPFEDFSSAVFRRQAEISGIACAVAEHISWMRKVPSGGSPLNSSLWYMEMLENIETRIRELQEIAQTDNKREFQEMVAVLQELAPPDSAAAIRLGSLEEELQSQAREMSHFFQTRYNAYILLSEQAQSMP